jgi:transposase
MIIIPDFLRIIIESHLDILLAWFSAYVYQRLIPPNHPLLRLNELVDFTPLEIACASFHKQNGMGCPITHSVPRLVRALLIRYLYDYSLRGTAAAICEQIAVKQFVGYPLHSSGISYSSLHRFETYVCEQHPRLFFDTVLSQILTAFPEQRLNPQIADTFAMLAKAQMETLIGRLRHAAALLLLSVHRDNPGQFHELTDQLDLLTLVGPNKERAEFLLGAAEKEARLSATAAQIVTLLNLVQQIRPRSEAVCGYEKMLQAVLNKEIDLTLNEAGQAIGARQFTEKERGTYRPTSATDPEATIRNHGKSKDNGYNVHVAATTDFICEIQATTGSQPDATGIIPLLEAEKEHHDLRPDRIIYDQAAGYGATIAAVAQATAGETQLVVKPVRSGKKKGGACFGPLDCRLTEQIDETTGEIQPALVCPGEQTTVIRYRASSKTGWCYRIPADKCAGCPLTAACRGDKVRPDSYRQWYVSDYRAPVLAARAYARTESFKQDMKLRPQVERVIAGLVLHCGARFARFRGLTKVDFQAKMCATAYNLKRWLNLSDSDYRTRPRRTAAQAVLSLATAA